MNLTLAIALSVSPLSQRNTFNLSEAIQQKRNSVGHVLENSLFGRGGTGFLVGPCHALTAKHNVAKKPRLGMRVKFVLAKSSSSWGDVVLMGDYANGRRRSHEHYGDWALIELDRCLGKYGGYLQLGSRAPSTQLILLHPRRLEGCQILLRLNYSWYSSCWAKPGFSGSPVLAFEPGTSKLQVVGVVSAALWDPKAIKWDGHAGYTVVVPTVWENKLLSYLREHVGGPYGAVSNSNATKAGVS